MKRNKSGIHRRKYDAEFKEEVIKMALNGRPVREISESLGISESLIHKWKSRYTGCSAASSPSGSLPIVEGVSAADYERLRARLREVEQERDILKKRWAFSAGGTKCGI